jgi:hypothetical protein
MVSRYEPLITINAMVKIGSWTIGPIYYGHPRNCDRCNTVHEYVWVCTVDPEVPDDVVAEKLHGKRVWWVGSKCGPTLEEVSDRKWDKPPKELARKLQLYIDATRAIEQGRASGHEWHYLHLVEEWLPQPLAGTLTPHLQKVLRRHVNGVLNTLKEEAWKAEQAKAPPWRHRLLGMPT